MDERIEIVNEIIKKIASLDRQFFYHKGKVAYIFRVNKQLYMRNEYSGIDMLLPTGDKPVVKGFHHGGTIWGLTKDFVQFIRTGKESNGEHGYGGLHSIHWGYQPESMVEIRELATSLNYL